MHCWNPKYKSFILSQFERAGCVGQYCLWVHAKVRISLVKYCKGPLKAPLGKKGLSSGWGKKEISAPLFTTRYEFNPFFSAWLLFLQYPTYNRTSPTNPSSTKIIENFGVNHGGQRICHSTIAHGAAAPQPSASTSSPHHGRRRLRLVWAQSIVGVRTMHHSTQRYIVTDKTPQIWLPSTTIVAFHHFPPPFRCTETTDKGSEMSYH